MYPSRHLAIPVIQLVSNGESPGAEMLGARAAESMAGGRPRCRGPAPHLLKCLHIRYSSGYHQTYVGK